MPIPAASMVMSVPLMKTVPRLPRDSFLPVFEGTSCMVTVPDTSTAALRIRCDAMRDGQVERRDVEKGWCER